MVRRGERMYECVKPFTTTYGPGRVAIGRGERVIASHDLLRRFPTHFREGLSLREMVVRAAGEREAEQRQDFLRAIGALDKAPATAAVAKPRTGYLKPPAKRPAPKLGGHLPARGEIRFSDKAPARPLTLQAIAVLIV